MTFMLTMTKASGNYIESFTSRLLRPDGVNTVNKVEEDMIKWCAGGLYAGASDTVIVNSDLMFLNH